VTALLPRIVKKELSTQSALAIWCSRSSDTQTGEISRKTDITRTRGQAARVSRAAAVSPSGEAAATPQLIAAVIPSRARVAARAGGRAGPVRRLPLAAVPEILSLPDEVAYGFGRMDESGRVGDRAVIGTLGWKPGDPLTLTAAAGVVIARHDPAGPVLMPAKPYVVIPAVLRRRCGVLLAVFPGEDALAAYSFAVVDQALRAHSPFAQSAGGES
jgi:hypothetical protein